MEDLKRITYYLDKLYQNRVEKLIIFDIGSRDCKEAIEFSKLYPNSKIYSFEPNPDAIKIAKKNIVDFTNISLIEKAVSEKDGLIKFYAIDPEKTTTTHPDGNIGASSIFKASGKYPIENYVQNEIEVESTTIETFCNDMNIKKIDFVWVDLQGAEYLAFKGMGKYLSTIDIIHTEAEFFEIYSEQYFFEDIKKILRKNFFLISGNIKHELFDNFIFINKKYFFKFLKNYIIFQRNNFYKIIKS